MSVEVVMPRAGLTMVEGTISEWKVPEGASVKKGDVLMEYENEKNMIEYEALDSGIIHLVAKEGDTVKVGGLIAYLAQDQTEYEQIASAGAGASSAVDSAPAEEPASKPEAAPGPAAAPGSASAPAKRSGRVSATGLAKKMAKEAGIDILDVTPTGADGIRVRARDVEAYLAAPRPAAGCADSAESVITEIPWKGVRAAIAKNMYNSVQQTAQCTMACEVNATKLLTLRESLKQDQEMLGVKITVNDLLCKMLGKVMLKHPMANATFDGSTLYEHSHVDLSVAVATEDGLMVPVVKHIDTLTLTEISRKVKDLAERAKTKSLLPDESSGASLTITNVGMFPIHMATPILNPPQVLIVGVGQPVQKPVVQEDGTIGVGSMMNIFVTVDHRVIDGMMTGRLLADIKAYIEHPEMILA